MESFRQFSMKYVDNQLEVHPMATRVVRSFYPFLRKRQCEESPIQAEQSFLKKRKDENQVRCVQRRKQNDDKGKFHFTFRNSKAASS